MFSATFRKKIERLARDILVDPIRVVQGDIGEVTRCFSVSECFCVEFKSSFTTPDGVGCFVPAASDKKTQLFIRVFCSCLKKANEDVTQVVELLLSGSDKWGWLTRRLVEFTSTGSVLIFVTKKANCEELANNLIQEGYSLGLLHGDMDQSERNKVISDFKKKNLPVLVATDVAGV